MPRPYVFQSGNSGYCNKPDLISMIKNFESYSTLDDAQMEKCIEDASDEIELTLAPYYVTPITGPQSLVMLRLMTKRLAAALCVKDYMLSSEPNASQMEKWEEWVNLVLADIISGEMQLFDAPGNSEKPTYPKGYGATMNPDFDKDVTPTTAPIFQRQGRGWQSNDLL